MKALGDLPARRASPPCRRINRAAPNPLFMLVLFGTAVPARAGGPAGAARASRGRCGCRAAPACYLVGIVLTAVYHVPHNDALALVDPNAAGAAGTWHTYLVGWNLLNHVRTLTSAAAAVCFTLAARADDVSERPPAQAPGCTSSSQSHHSPRPSPVRALRWMSRSLGSRRGRWPTNRSRSTSRCGRRSILLTTAASDELNSPGYLSGLSSPSVTDDEANAQ